MIRLPILSAVLLGTIAACSTADPPPDPSARATVAAEYPLKVLPGDAALGEVRKDLLATAADRFGQSALAEALAAPTHLVAKRFAGMLPPPPPGETSPEYVPPAALLMKAANGWVIATPAGWHPVKPDQAAAIERTIADPAFWAEPAASPPCPDYGASLLMLKVPGKPETVRKSSCPGIADRAVRAALDG